MSKPLSPEARTVPLPGVDQRPTPGPVIDLRGPRIRRATFGTPEVTHYDDFAGQTLCGLRAGEQRGPHREPVCQECRVEAARLRATVVR